MEHTSHMSLYEHQAEHFDQLVSRDTVKEIIYTDVVRRINQTKRGMQVVVDIGCGSGRFIEMLAAYSNEIQVYYGDYSLSQVINTRRKVDATGERPTTGFQVNLSQGLPINDCSVDILTFHYVLSEIPDIEFILDECYRVLQDDGLLVVSMTSPLSDILTATVRPEKISGLNLEAADHPQLVSYHLGSDGKIQVPHYYRPYKYIVNAFHEKGFGLTEYDIDRYTPFNPTNFPSPKSLHESLVLYARKGKKTWLSKWERKIEHDTSKPLRGEKSEVSIIELEGHDEQVVRSRRVREQF